MNRLLIHLGVLCVAGLVAAHGQEPALAVSITTNGSTQIHGSVRTFGALFPPSPPGFVHEKTVIWNVAKRPYMGLQIRDLNDQLARFFQVEGGGVLVESVEPEGPADNAGVKAGDIITRLDDTQVTGMNALFQTLNTHAEGDVVTLGVIRREKRWEAKLTLAKGTMQSSTMTLSGDGEDDTSNHGVSYGQQRMEIDIQKLIGSMGRLTPPAFPGQASAREQEALRQELDDLKREMQELRRILRHASEGMAKTNRMDAAAGSE